MNLLIKNIKSVLIVGLSYLILELLHFMPSLIGILFFTEHVDISVGALLFLPIGAILFTYLVFRESIFPGVLILIYVVGILMNISNDLIWQYTLISAFGPYVAIRIFEFFRLGDLSKPFEIDSMKLLLLVLISALINTIFKFLSFYYHSHESMIEHWEHADPVFFLMTFFPGDIIGGFVGVLLCIYLYPKFQTKPLAK